MMSFIHKYDAMLKGSQNDKEMGECANVQIEMHRLLINSSTLQNQMR